MSQIVLIWAIRSCFICLLFPLDIPHQQDCVCVCVCLYPYFLALQNAPDCISSCRPFSWNLASLSLETDVKNQDLYYLLVQVTFIPFIKT